MAWESDASATGTGWVTWGVCFLLAVIGGGMSVLLRSQRPDKPHSAGERLTDADRRLQRRSSPVSPISEGIWIGTLEFEPRTPDDLLRLLTLRISVDDRGDARAVGCPEMGEDPRVVGLRWEPSGRTSERLSKLTIELEGADGHSQIRLTLRRESRTWVTAPGGIGPSLCLRRAAGSVHRPNAA